jgi:ABC-type nitrate/sulfonate/bicarbonate transport system permease component
MANSLGRSQALVGIAMLLAVWEIATRWFHPLPVILPSPVAVIDRLAHMLASADTWADLGISIARVLGGFALGALTGVATAVLLARHPLLDRSLHYPLVALRFVVPFAWVPIAAYWFGLNEAGKIFITWYASFFVIVFQVRAGIDTVPALYLKVAHTFGLSRQQTLWQVILPAAWPSIVVGLRLGLSFAWVAILAAEMVNANSGIGFFINYSGQFLATDNVMAGMVIIGILGFAMDQGLSWLGQRLLPGAAAQD